MSDDLIRDGWLTPDGHAAVNGVPIHGLRDRLTAALKGAPSSYRRDPSDTAPWRNHDRHGYSGGCALCMGEVEPLADAVLAVVQPELAQLRTWAEAAQREANRLDGIAADYQSQVFALREQCEEQQRATHRAVAFRDMASDAETALQVEANQQRAQVIAEVEALVRDRASALQGTVAQVTAEAIANLIAGMADTPGGA